MVGSGPAGLAAAQQLARAGHDVTVFEKNDRIGGLLRYGIPNFKMEKHLIDRRLEQMAPKGCSSRPTRTSAATSPVEDLRREFDAILLAGGAEQPRDLNVPGRELKGIHFAMEFLPQQNRVCEGDTVAEPDPRHRQARRHHRRRRHRRRLPGHQPPPGRALRHAVRTAAQAARRRARRRLRGRCGPCNCASKARTKKAACAIGASPPCSFTGDDDGNVKQLHAVRVGPPPKFEPLPGTEFTLDADLVLLAMGFPGPVKNGMLEQLGVELDARGNVATDANYMSTVPGVFAAGDMRRGQSLVVWAIAEGRKAAAGINRFLIG